MQTFGQYTSELSRELTGVDCISLFAGEPEAGIFSYGEVTFGKRILFGSVVLNRVEVDFDRFNWQESTAEEIAAEIEKRVLMVKTAFAESKPRSVEVKL